MVHIYYGRPTGTHMHSISNVSLGMTNYPQMGHSQGHVSHFKFWDPRYIFGISKLFYTLPLMSTSGRLLLKKMHSGSCALIKFWEITDNISETVQDRDRDYNGRLRGNHTWAIKWHQH